MNQQREDSEDHRNLDGFHKNSDRFHRPQKLRWVQLIDQNMLLSPNPCKENKSKKTSLVNKSLGNGPQNNEIFFKLF